MIVTDDFYSLPTREDEGDLPVCIICGCLVQMLYRDVHREKCNNDAAND